MKKFLINLAFCFVCLSSLFGCSLFPSNCEINVVNLNVEGGTATSSEEYKEGEEITLVAKPKEGYYFEGWIDEEGNVISYEEKYTFEVEKSMDLTVNFKKGTSLLIDNTKLIGIKDGVFEVDYEKREFDLKHADGKDHVGYWYEGADEGYEKEGSPNYIKFDDVKNGTYYQFHEGIGYFYGVAVDEDAYTAFLNCTTKAELDELISSKKITNANFIRTNNESTEITNTFDLNSGNVLIKSYIYVDAADIEKVAVSTGFLYTGINGTKINNFVLGGRTFSVSVTMA